jgi:peptide deformylase
MINSNPDLNQLHLRCYPDPVLRDKAQPVENVNSEIAALADLMADIMVKSSGIGLAAPQVGLPLRLIVISLTGKREDVEVLINPVLSDFQGLSEIEEGCLSVPGVRAKVRRPAACAVTALNLDGNQFVMDAVDLAATVVQHEYDHLEGTLFIDRLNAVSRLSCRKTLKQLERDFQDKG